MRDDLHKAAPISKALQKLMQMAGRAADRADPARLRAEAVLPMLKEVEKGLPKGTAAHYSNDQENPSLFRRIFAGPTVSAFQQDLNAEIAADPTGPITAHLARAIKTRIDCESNESAAAMLAAGGSQKEVSLAVTAYRRACLDATSDVVRAYLDGKKPRGAPKALSLDDTIAPGPRARPA